nr:NADH dehydrogenase subunit 6 [Athripsodes cinereus]
MTMNFLLLFISSPMMIMTTLIIQTISMSLIIGMMNQTFWYSYILFLIIIGGLMILFLYMTSLISNNLYNFNFKKLILIFCLIISMTLWLYLNNPHPFSYKHSFQLLTHLQFNSLMKLYNTQTMTMIILIMNYLFFTLMISTKIINLHYGPLRST